ncbi:MAG: PAS domain S-box protein, partial [Gloeobacteraceae cyanobacterium ES-bin-316]|nr:PAS domain S-box protein [Ferruginibacter sp.]
DYVIETMNEGMSEFWGRSVEQALNKPVFDVLPELRDQGIKELLDNVYNTGERCVMQELSINLIRNGKLENVFVKFVYEPLREADGSISGVMALAHEITEQVLSRKKIEESEEHFRQLADLMPSKISNATINGEVTYFSKSWLDFSGFSFEELRDFGYHQMLHPDELEEFQNRLQHAATTLTDLVMEMRFKNAAGDYVWHLNIASPVKDENGNHKMWVGVTTDIQKLKEDDQHKGDFIKMVSHELKTPVTSIKGYVQMLLSMLNDEKSQNELPLKISLNRIDAQILRLTRLITEMLDLSRIESGKLDLQKTSFILNELIVETIQDVLQTSKKHIIKLEEGCVCSVYADRDRMAEVLINFINNAVKYSPESGNIEVKIWEAGNNQVAVSVKDYGIGIDEKDQEKIFERFYRVAGKTEETFSGFGIGLFIASEVIERHDGKITVESKKGEGSTFTFILPLVIGT